VIADFRVILDACVLANFAVADVFLTFAEEPRLFLPRWSETILEETRRTQSEDFGWPDRLVRSFHETLRAHFPEAMVTGYEPLIEQCKNDKKDRHVLACAIHCQAEVIVTFKDFTHRLERQNSCNVRVFAWTSEPINIDHSGYAFGPAKDLKPRIEIVRNLRTSIDKERSRPPRHE